MTKAEPDRMAMQVLVVCTGNTCRSPMSAALLEEAVRKASDIASTIEVRSVGTAAHPGDAATDLAIRVMSKRGIDLSGHRASILSPEVVARADLVLTMTEAHKEAVAGKVPAAAGKVFTICEYAGIEGEIEDPLPKGTEIAYEHCAEQLAAITPRILARLRIFGVVRRVCEEVQRGAQRDPIWYHEAFGKRAKAADDVGDGEIAKGCRLLAAVFSMCFKRGPDGPFGPLVVWPDGSRSFLPKDLKPEDVARLESLINCGSDPVFVARIADVLWLVAKNHEHARRALRAYLDSVRIDTESWVSKRDWLSRATDLAMALGKKASERADVAAEFERLFEASKGDCFTPERGHWPAALAEILIDNRLASDWERLGDDCVTIARGFPIAPGCDEPRRYYELASRAYEVGRLSAKAKEARLAIAQHWEAEAGAFRAAGGDSFQISHRLEQAIHAYRKAGGEGERVQALMRDLKQANEKMLTEMKAVSVPLDVEPLVRAAERAMAGKAGMAAIESFAALYEPAPYADVRASALSQAQASPLAALIGAKIVTVEGNVAASVPGIAEDEAAKTQAMVVQGYTMRQSIAGATTLEVARRAIGTGPDESWRSVVRELVHANGFAPEDRRDIFERAVIAGFVADRLVFAHLAIPQMENSLRVMFRKAGLPITTMNAKGIQEERDLNSLLTDEAAKTVLGEALVWEMRSLLIERTGPNLRNRLCHGLLGSDDFDRPAMNVLLWVTVFLLLRYTGSGSC